MVIYAGELHEVISQQHLTVLLEDGSFVPIDEVEEVAGAASCRICLHECGNCPLHSLCHGSRQ